jgi:hypothetical protein
MARWKAATIRAPTAARRAHDPEEWVPVFGQDHARIKEPK